MYLVSIEESIKDILLTPLNSRVMLPNYGSKIYELIDKKINDNFKANLSWYVVEAVELWEKRVKIDEVKLISFKDNRLKIKLILIDGNEINLNLELK